MPLRLSEPGFASLASIIVSQQVSRASADAIFGRFVKLVDPLTPEAVLGAGEAIFREAGFSRPKQRAMMAAAGAVADGLDLIHFCDLDGRRGDPPPDGGAGHRAGGRRKCYLLFSAGHPDIFPARDVALQSAVGRALGLETTAGREGADRASPNHGRPGAASRRGFFGRIIARSRAGMPRQ